MRAVEAKWFWGALEWMPNCLGMSAMVHTVGMNL